MKIPNHTLYAEKIYNLTETSGAVYDFTFCFNIIGASHTDMVSHVAHLQVYYCISAFAVLSICVLCAPNSPFCAIITPL